MRAIRNGQQEAGPGLAAAARTPHRARPLLTLLEVVALRDPSPRMQGESVGDFAAPTAEDPGSPPAPIRSLRLAGILHGCGEVAARDEILGGLST